MARTMAKSRSRQTTRLHVQVYRDVLDSPQYAALSPRATKLLYDIYAQYRGHNNGDLCVAWTLMRPRGWTSKDQLLKAKKELIDKKWIDVSRAPRAKREPTLYYLTFLNVDECRRKLDIPKSATPCNSWKSIHVKSLPRSTGKVAPQHGAKKCGKGANRTNIVGLCPAPRVENSVCLPRTAGPFLELPSGDHLPGGTVTQPAQQVKAVTAMPQGTASTGASASQRNRRERG